MLYLNWAVITLSLLSTLVLCDDSGSVDTGSDSGPASGPDTLPPPTNITTPTSKPKPKTKSDAPASQNLNVLLSATLVSAVASLSVQCNNKPSFLKPFCMDPFTTIYLCRHGETDCNANGILQGRSVDAPLNATGLHQAELLADRFKSIELSQIISSTLMV